MKPLKITETELWEYLSRNADTSTIQKVEDWKNSTAFDEVLYTKIKQIYDQTEKQDFDINEAKKRFFKAVDPKKVIWKEYLKYAAIITILITSTYFFTTTSLNQDKIIVQTTFGEYKDMELADGSKVWLSASSEISYSVENPRTLYLKGEAFFDVAKDSLHPFTVTTPDDITVMALGTSFNIKSYKNSSNTETKLLTGKVEISSKTQFGQRIFLVPNEKFSFHKKTKETVKTILDANTSKIPWREGKIQFENTSFKEIAIDLKAQYGKQIKFENEDLASTKFTGSFDTATPITEIFEILKISKDFTYKLNTETNEWMIK